MKTVSARQTGRATPKTKPTKWPALLGIVAIVAGSGFGLSRVLHTAPVPTAPATAQVAPAPVIAQKLDWKVQGVYPHDPNAFTQGLLWQNGGFYEGTGIEGKSSLRRVEFPSGKVLQKRELPKEVFGEGVALAGDKLVQLTWRSNLGYVYDRATFDLLKKFTYTNEGWGLTYDGHNLIQSDGTSTLTYLDPQSYQPVRQLKVTMNGQGLKNLNELEWIEGKIWANVWQTDLIVRIDPATGQVNSFLDLAGLLPKKWRTGNEDVLNGIAYDPDKKRLFVTGKQWPRLFEIKVMGGTA